MQGAVPLYTQVLQPADAAWMCPGILPPVKQDPDSRQGGMGLLQVLQLTGRKLSAQRTRTFTCASK